MAVLKRQRADGTYEYVEFYGKFIRLEETFTAQSNNVSIIQIQNSFSKVTDLISVYYDGFRLKENENFIISTDNRSIELLDWNINIGEKIEIEILKNATNVDNLTSGSQIENLSIDKHKLSQVLQDEISSSGGIAEANAKSYIDTKLANYNLKLESYKHILKAQFNNQKGFSISDIFNQTTDTIVDVVLDGVGLSADKYMIINNDIYLLNGVPYGTILSFTILRNVTMKEQESPLIAGDLMAGYYGKVNGLITGDDLFAKTGLTAGVTKHSGDITWLKFSHNYKTLLIADRTLKHTISWDNIQAVNLIKGKAIEINGKYYLCRLMTGGYTNPSPASVGGEWNDLIVRFTPDVNDSNWSGDGRTICVEIHSTGIDKRLSVGGTSVTSHGNYAQSIGNTLAGYRPVLELL